MSLCPELKPGATEGMFVASLLIAMIFGNGNPTLPIFAQRESEIHYVLSASNGLRGQIRFGV